MSDESLNVLKKREAAGAVLYSLHQGETYYLLVRRAHTKKWNTQIMLGPAETQDLTKEQDVEKGLAGTMSRGLQEEIKIRGAPNPNVRIVQTGERIFGVPEGNHYGATLFRVRLLPLSRLQKVARYVNRHQKDPNFELADARIIRGRDLSAVDRSELQPHTREVFDDLIAYDKKIRDRYAQMKPFLASQFTFGKMVKRVPRRVVRKTKQVVKKTQKAFRKIVGGRH